MATPQNTSQETALFCRYILSSLDRLMQCLEGLNHEQLNWRPAAPHTNSLYVLAVHTLANTEENILHTLYNRPGSRDRELEFQAQATSIDHLKQHWQALRPRLQEAIQSLPREELLQERTHPRRGLVTGLDILIVVARHAAEHLGQAELTRDIVISTLPVQP
jgi:uncharacterized damage-inducible protein DinB